MHEDLPSIPLFDLRLDAEDIDAVTGVLRSGWLTMGPRVQEFERAFADHLGIRHAIAVANGTAALHLACLGAGIGPGDEVIVPSFTFVATANAVLYCGARPVFADIIGLEHPTIDPAEVARLITPRTRAVIAVHFGGYPARADALAELCSEHGLSLIEDAAHAPAGDIGGRKLGTLGLVNAFSFFSNKVLPVGEGGLLATDDDDVAERVRALRSHAMTSMTWDRYRGHAASYDVVDLGYNYRMDEMHAGLALSRLSKLDAEVELRRELTLSYRRRLAELPGIVVPYTDDEVMHSACYVMPIMLGDADGRNRFRARLREQDRIETSVLYPAVHEFSAYRERFPGVSLERTELAARSEVTIPLYPHMMGVEQERVFDAIERALDD